MCLGPYDLGMCYSEDHYLLNKSCSVSEQIYVMYQEHPYHAHPSYVSSLRLQGEFQWWNLQQLYTADYAALPAAAAASKGGWGFVVGHLQKQPA